jgi:hypothetical protein
LERVVHSTQAVPDIKDEEVRIREQEEDRKAMVADGWLFDSDAHELIGLPCRRFFSGFGCNDGNVVAYLPPEKNEGVASWHVVHNDGDAEDLYEEDVRKAVRQFAEGLHEDDEGGEDEDENPGLSSDEESENGEDVTPRTKAVGDDRGTRLWTTSGVRQRWINAVNNSRTVGDGKALIKLWMNLPYFGC